MLHAQNAYTQGLGSQQQQQADAPPRPSTELEAAVNELSHGLLAVEHVIGEIARRVLPPVPEAVTAAGLAPGRATYSSSMVSLNDRVRKLGEIATELSTRI